MLMRSSKFMKTPCRQIRSFAGCIWFTGFQCERADMGIKERLESGRSVPASYLGDLGLVSLSL